MCKYFNTLASGSAATKEALLALITVIPKEGKDHTAPANYRPILLLNIDIKILAQILANRLKSILPTIVHPEINRVYCWKGSKRQF